MKATEFEGFICDNPSCRKPFTIEQAEGEAVHLEGTLTLNNTSGMVNKDFCNKTCMLEAFTNVPFGEWS